MPKINVRDVGRVRIKYKPVARCEGVPPTETAERRPCRHKWALGGGIFSNYTPNQIRAAAAQHALQNPRHEVYVDVLDRESFVCKGLLLDEEDES